MPIQHEYILNPVTAVEFCQHGSDQLLIVAGEGSYLKVFEAGTCKLLRQVEIFHDQAIHGIAVQDVSTGREALRLVIWGGSYLVTLRNQDFERLLGGGSNSLAPAAISGPDWILDVALSPEDHNAFALVTAHNTVLQARLGDGPIAVVFENPSSPSRSILYSAHLTWDASSSLLVAAGTVFGEIIVWKCNPSGQSMILHTFEGHEGSIFGVNISGPITFKDNSVGRLLASCSDDRTIRVWKLASNAPATAGGHANMILRETGFGGNQVGDTGYQCLATVMGHSSRIWNVKFMIEKSDTNQDHVSVLSFGEDSTTQQWALDFGHLSHEHAKAAKTAKTAIHHEPASPQATTAKLIHLNTFAFHSGKHIWATSSRATSHQRSALITGGADGKISTYEVQLPDKSEVVLDALETRVKATAIIGGLAQNSHPDYWDLEDVLQTGCPINTSDIEIIPHAGPAEPDEGASPREVVSGKPAKLPKAKKVPKDAFNRYGFVSPDQVIMTTTFGRVFLGNISTNIKWQEITLPESSPNGLRSYALVSGFPELGLAFLAGASGKIYIYHTGNCLREVGDVGFKVADIFKIFNAESQTYELLVTTLGGEVATLFTLDLSSSEIVQLGAKVEYQLPGKLIVTSVARVNGVLILGSRAGIMAMCTPALPDSPAVIWTPSPDSTPDSITTIIPISPAKLFVPNGISHILTTDRSGKYSIFSCSFLGSVHMNSQKIDADIRLVHEGYPPFGPMIEAAWFTPSSSNSSVDQHLILCGFKSKNFVVWNETKHFEISNIECGGAHRSYAYSPLSTNGKEGGHFVYTKASKLYIHTQQAPSHTILKTGGHGREIKACAVSPDCRYIATGAEDTEIRLWSYDSSTVNKICNSLACKAIAQKHTTGIQHLQFHSSNQTSSGDTYLFSSGGNEEFFIWSVSPIPTSSGSVLGIVCESSFPDPTIDRDLRIMSFDVVNYADIPDTLLISLAFSDSTILTYLYGCVHGRGVDRKDKSWKLVAKGRYTSSCIMQISHLKVESGSILILTAATDGRLVFWKGTLPPAPSSRPTWTLSSSPAEFEQEPTDIAQLEIVSSRKVHQSSIKALDLIVEEPNIIVATGGDDNAIGVSVYSHSNLTSPPQSFILKSAHAAAVTGISFVPSSAKDKYTVVSSSNDQRVKEWEVELTHSQERGEADVHIKQLSDAFTAVADVCDLAVLSQCEGEKESAKVLVVGNGMEIWDMSA